MLPPDTLPVTLERVYRQNDSAVRPFGVGMNFNYGMFFENDGTYQYAELILPDGGRVHPRW